MRLFLWAGLLLGCAFVSGLASLIYEVVWLREVGLLYGQTLHATGTVLAAFMAGLALGSFFWGQQADRATVPIRVYGFLELGAGLAALILPFGLGQVERLTASLCQQTPSLPSLLLQAPLAFLLMLLPTFFLGGTLPALGRCLAEAERDSWTGKLYGLSTLGAALGAFLSAFVFLPSLGSRHTNLTAALVSCTLGVVCLAVGRAQANTSPPQRNRVRHHPRVAFSAVSGRLSLLLCIGASGCAALIYEVVWTRLLCLILENTVYAFSLMLSTLLISLALGSFCIAKLSLKEKTLSPALGWTEWAAALSSLLTVSLLPLVAGFFYRTYASGGFGSSWPLFIVSQELLCGVVMLIPAALLGMSLPLAWRISLASDAGVGTGLGQILCANTVRERRKL